MKSEKNTPNRLRNETSPYLLQHANNPVDWYPWGQEAFERARQEDKPIFLSIGYSTCHWCHVMAHESFEDPEVAALLNRDFIAIKVDKEERPDVDGVYMTVCQALTGNGGWPMSIFMTPEQKPFFAGTYFPKTARGGGAGFMELLRAVGEKWAHERELLLRSAEEIVDRLAEEAAGKSVSGPGPKKEDAGEAAGQLIASAVALYKQSFDETFGGFGSAPKFPAPHNLIFLLEHYRQSGDVQALKMAEVTLQQMYRGGLFDHIGYGFSRYSTDRYFLVPHFEKMLYDNALLTISYCRAYDITKKTLYKDVAEKVATYVLREMTGPEGGFYSAQDADSQGVEGKYYVFQPQEITTLLGEETGSAFNRYYDITQQGNFAGQSIPNLLNSQPLSEQFNENLPLVYEYRRGRAPLHLDDKVLTSWNSLMIAALAALYRSGGNEIHLKAAQAAQKFIETVLCEGDTLIAAARDGKRSVGGFLEDYAFYTFALLSLYEVTHRQEYADKALRFCHRALEDFYDKKSGGFYQYGKDSEPLIIRLKETYDGAIPSGNSIMAGNLLQLFRLTGDKELEKILQQQLRFLSAAAADYPPGHSAFLTVLVEYEDSLQRAKTLNQQKRK